MTSLHPDLAPVAHLVGTWRGEGHGEYPTIESFDYLEEITFSHVGKPFLAYQQRTRETQTGRPLHAEMGYLRVIGFADAELVLVHPTGIVEIAAGTIDETGVTFRSTVHRTPTAKSVTDVERTISIADDRLTYRVAMAAVGHELTHHLAAELVRD